MELLLAEENITTISDEQCCDDYVQSTDSCVCGCDTYLNGSGGSIFWIAAVILTAVLAVCLVSLMMRRKHKKSLVKGMMRKK